MTHIPGDRTYVLLPRCLKWSRCIIFQVVLWFVLFTAHAPLQAVSLRNMTYVDNETPYPVWDETREKTVGKCLNFHNAIFPTGFFYWPEDNPLFHHCCTSQDPESQEFPERLKFKYSQYGTELSYAFYRDVGYVDQCLPFWKCQDIYSRIFVTQIFKIRCEITDLMNFYKNRFWRSTVWKYSLRETIFPWIPILEVVVISLALAIFPWTWRRTEYIAADTSPTMSMSPWENLMPTGKIWLRSIWKRLLMDWSHLCLLAVVGNSLLEAMRRQSIYTMQSKVFFDYSMLYLVLFVLVSAASVMQQLAYWIGCATGDILLPDDAQQDVESPATEINQERYKSADSAEGIQHKSADAQEDENVNKSKEFSGEAPLIYGTVELETYHGDARQDELHSQSLTEVTDIERNSEGGVPQDVVAFNQVHQLPSQSFSYKKLKESAARGSPQSVHLFTFGDDYKWQPLGAQFAIMFALWSFLTYAIVDSDEGSNLWGIVLGFIVQVGCLSTGLFGVVVFSHRTVYVIKFLVKLGDFGDNSGRTGRAAKRSLSKLH